MSSGWVAYNQGHSRQQHAAAGTQGGNTGVRNKRLAQKCVRTDLYLTPSSSHMAPPMAHLVSYQLLSWSTPFRRLSDIRVV